MRMVYLLNLKLENMNNTKLPVGMSQLDYLWANFGSYHVSEGDDTSLVTAEMLKKYVSEHAVTQAALDQEAKRVNAMINVVNESIMTVNNNLVTSINTINGGIDTLRTEIDQNTSDIAEVKPLVNTILEKVTEVQNKLTEINSAVRQAEDKVSENTKSLLSEINRATEVEQTLLKQIQALSESKQDTLISGANIKTINGETILGSGNITIDSLIVDDELSSTSTHPIQNKVVANNLAMLQGYINNIENLPIDISVDGDTLELSLPNFDS